METTHTPDADLIVALRERQDALREFDVEFGPRLGVSRQQWEHVRDGRWRAGLKTLAGIRRAFPELTPLVEACLADR